MKKYILYILLLSVMFTTICELRRDYISSPELMGRGVMYSYQHSDRMIAVIFAAGGWFVYGRKSDCRIVQLYGIISDGWSGKTQCKLEYNKQKTIFRGWYEFRGHPRPWCGALNKDNIPLGNCRSEK